jgi:proteasome lid subunit RPN8/RPN11
VTATRLVLAASVRDDLVEHAREGATETPPVEVCGVLAGERDANGERRAIGARRVPNVADRPTVAYELEPAAALAAIDAIEDAGREVLGFYHSHPGGPPRPSDADRAQAAWPGYCYLVVSPSDPDAAEPDSSIGAWLWTGEAFERLSIVVD